MKNDLDKVFGRPSKTVVIGTPLCTPEELGHDPKKDGEVHYTSTRFIPQLLVELGYAKSNSEVRRNRPKLCLELIQVTTVFIKYGRHLLYIIVGEQEDVFHE